MGAQQRSPAHFSRDSSAGKATPSTHGDWRLDENGRGEETGLRLELMPIEALLFPGPVNEDHDHNRRDRPVSDRPIENWSKFRKNPCGEFPDFVHVTTSGKSNSRASQV